MTYENILKLFELRPGDEPFVLLVTMLAFVFVLAARRAIFGPYLSLIEARESATVGAEQRAAATTNKALEVEAAYDQAIAEARVAALQKKIVEVDAARKKASVMIDAAEEEAQERLRNVRWQLKEQEASVRSRLQSDADQLAQEIVQKVMQ